MLGVVDETSRAVGMALGLRKCAAVLVTQGKVSECENFAIPNEREIGALGAEESYRYLGINQSLRNHDIRVKRKLTEKYLARLKAIWTTRLSGKTKTKLTNSWAISVFRYYFSCLKWTRGELRDLDISTRRILRQNKSHHYNAALERLYLPRTAGGRGLISLESCWERTVISTATYLANSKEDQHCLRVWKTQDFLESNSRWSLRKAAERILEKYQLPYSFEKEGTVLGDNVVLPRHTSKAVQKAQESTRFRQLSVKKIHGEYHRQWQRSGGKIGDPHLWLVHGRFQSETEALAVAIQDGVVHTKAYHKGVLKDKDLADDLCRNCKERPETVGHLLSACGELHWSLHKERHDRVVYQLMLAVVKHFNLIQPEALNWRAQGWSGVGVIEGTRVKVEIDLSKPTDAQLEHRRPDMIVTLDTRMYIVEVACAWDSIIQEREVEKRRKYRDLAADLGSQHPSKRVHNMALVVGDLGTINNFREELQTLDFFTPTECNAILRECQHEVIASAIRIIRRTLSSSTRE